MTICISSKVGVGHHCERLAGEVQVIAIALLFAAAATGATPESTVPVSEDVYLAVVNHLVKPGSILCVSIDGADPEPALARRIAALPGTARKSDCRTKDNITVYEPGADRAAPVLRNCVEGEQGMKTCELSGPRAVFMNIGDCVAKPAEDAECRVSSYCECSAAEAGNCRFAARTRSGRSRRRSCASSTE